VLDETRRLDLAENSTAHRRRERVAAERAPVVPALEETRCLAEGHEGADREAPRQPLRDRDGIRNHPELFEREPRPGATDPRLNLVHDEQSAVLASQFPCACDEALG